MHKQRYLRSLSSFAAARERFLAAGFLAFEVAAFLVVAAVVVADFLVVVADFLVAAFAFFFFGAVTTFECVTPEASTRRTCF